MKLRHVLVTLLLLLSVSADFAHSQQAPTTKEQTVADKEKEADILRLMEVMGTRKLLSQMSEQIVQMTEKMLPPQTAADERSRKLSKRMLEEIMAEMNSEEYVNRFVPIYSRVYTHEEIKELIAFYQSPLGKKLIQSTPKLMQESMAESQKWMQVSLKKVFAKLSVEFPELKDVEKVMFPEKP